MVGRVGSRLGEAGINISAAAVGRQDTAQDHLAVMAVTTDQAVPADVLGEIAASEGFVTGRAIPLG
jgi:D-3-phosphoglycerate dehydrogenase